MKYDIDLIKTIVSYNIDNVDFKDNVYINVEKNKEKLTLILTNMQTYKNFCKNIYLQNEYGVINKPTDKQILSTMIDRNCNWLLTDNNLNFIQCFDDKTYYPICKDSRQSFLRNKEHWGVGELVDGKLKLIHNLDEDNICDFSLNREGNFSQRVFIRDEKRFVFVEKNKVRTLLPSELIYLFHKSIKNELSLHTIFNKSWFYGK